MQFVGEQANLLPERGTVPPSGEVAVAHFAGCWRDERRGHTEKRRFACAVGAEETDDLAAARGQRNMRDGAAAAIVSRNVDQMDLVEIDHHAARSERSDGSGPRSSLSSAP